MGGGEEDVQVALRGEKEVLIRKLKRKYVISGIGEKCRGSMKTIL